MSLRDFQSRAVESVFAEWRERTSTLVVCPTGTGKTRIFSEIISRIQPTRTIVLAHREELVAQAVRRLWNDYAIAADVEMADFQAGEGYYNRAPVVVSTIQTQIAGNGGYGRMKLFRPQDFGLIVCDEAHHYTSPSFRRVLEYYKQNTDLKIVGVTATPDRADEQALGQVFETVAFDYEILDAIRDGWLVPVDQKMVNVEGLDFSGIRTTAGDLNGADLARVMEAEKNLHGIASAAIEIIGTDKRTLVFTVTVKQAEMLSEIFNRHRPGMSGWVCGKTPKDQRHKIFEDFSNGTTQVLVNVGVATEGYDNPAVEVIVQARPTKSRCLYAQIIGRSLRPLTGVVDGLATPDERKAAIAASVKPRALVLDFVGNAGRHKLMTTADILGGRFSEEAIGRAVAKARKNGKAVRMDEALDEAERDIRAEIEERKKRDAARKSRLVAKARFSVKTINPFNAFELEPVRSRGWDSGKHLSEKQRALLLRQGIDPEGMPYGQAKQLLTEMFRRWNGNLATLKQCNLLKRYGYETKNLTMQDASKLIDTLAKNNWCRPEEEQAA
ncbi:MAG TPA: DEAD/DEAH box helicase family protein [Pyrinomonadaceae bacterium]|nr:DEAD/DEAH box helicase family protein [Pyrinomonadaceae bacterium]